MTWSNQQLINKDIETLNVGNRSRDINDIYQQPDNILLSYQNWIMDA